MTGETVQMMVLPSPVGDALPQVLLEDGGIWRETIPSGYPGPAKQSDLRRDIEAHLTPLMQQVGGTPPAPVPAGSAGFKNPFEGWFNALLPPEVREVLKLVANSAAPGAPPVLKIFLTPGAEWIPWELLSDGTEFLGLRFALCRLPIVRQRTEVRGSKDRDVRSVYSLLANKVLENGIRAAWEATFTPFAAAPAWEHRYPPNGADPHPTLDRIVEARQADIIHITCHGGLRDKDSNDFYWTLDHSNPQFFNYRITPNFARNASLGHRPLVFGNACASAATEQQGNLGALHGFGASFMMGGALNFIGTFAPITKTTAVEFASRFYRQLFGTGGAAGLPVAEALLATKRSFFDANHPDPSYLFYCLYGPPDTVYKPA
jgi:hypothetical protein